LNRKIVLDKDSNYSVVHVQEELVVEVLAFSLQNLPEVAIVVVGLLMTEITETGQGPCEGAHQEGGLFDQSSRNGTASWNILC
jgi:hypothetical protein